MFWKRASGRLLKTPWKAENLSMIRYGFREIPEVVGLGILTTVIMVPYMVYLYKSIRDDPYKQSAHKIHFTVMRPEQMPVESHKYCTKS